MEIRFSLRDDVLQSPFTCLWEDVIRVPDKVSVRDKNARESDWTIRD